jgi:signal transduction histidine kinase
VLSILGVAAAANAEAEAPQPRPEDPFGFSMRVWGVDEGLPQSTPLRMVLDDDGFVWGGTFGGLFRLDGSAILSFGLNELPGLESNQVTAIAPARAGGFWIGGGTAGVVLRIVDGVAVERIPRPEGLRDGADALFETADGTLWKWAFDVLYAYRAGMWTRVATDLPRLWPGVALVETAPGELLGGSADGFFRATADRFEREREPPFDYGERVFSLLRDRRGTLWAGFAEGLFALTTEGRIAVPGISVTVENVAQAPDGALWVTGERAVWRVQGAGLDEPGELEPERLRVTPVPWSGQRPVSLVLTRDGVALVGSMGGGVTAITPRVSSLTVLTDVWEPVNPLNVRSPAVHSVTADRLGRIWATQELGPLLRLDEVPGAARDPRAIRVGRQIPGAFLALAPSPDGAIWAVEPTSLLRVSEQGELTRIPLAGILAGESDQRDLSPRILLALGADSILVGMMDGSLFLITADGRGERLSGWDTPFRGGLISGVRFEDGTLGFGGIGTVRTRSPDGVWQTLDESDGIPPGAVRVLHPDPAGGLWIGSYGGGTVYRTPKGVTVPLDLQDPTISALIPQADGSFWIAQNSGLTVVSAETLDRVRRGEPAAVGFRRIRATDGVPEVNNGRPAAVQLPSGVMAIGTLQGLLAVDPARLPAPVSSPRIRVDRVRTPLRDARMEGPDLVLERGERLVELDLSYPSFRESDPVRVRYRLLGRGVRDEWVLTSSPRVIQFASLSPGTFRLEVETSKAGGPWVAGEPLNLRVVPSFWERRSVQILARLLVLTLVTVTAVSQVRARKAESMALRVRMQREADQAALAEQQRREMTMVSRQVMAGEMSASLTHEVSQPISAIAQTLQALRLEAAQDRLDTETLGESIDELLEQSMRARDIIQGFRRFLAEGLPTGEEVSVRRVFERVPVLLGHDLREAEARLAMELPDENMTVHGERVLLQQVVLILVSNAVEAIAGRPADRREIRVRVRAHGRGGFRVSVVDAGEGIPRFRRSTLFDPFQSTKPKGMGMGLSIARRIVLAHGGQISLRSQEGRGTVASFWVPKFQAKGGET